MPSRIRSHLTFANGVSLVALFVALGGGAYALTIPHNSVGAAQLRKGAVGRSELRHNAVTSSKVKNHTLLSRDFKAGQLPAGPRGPKGDPGTVDASDFFTRKQSDDRFVAKADAQPYAWGQVRADASLRPVSSRVVTVTHPATGIYCVLLKGSPQQSELEGSAVTLAGTSPQALFPHVTNGQGADCATEPGSHLNIRFFTAAGAPADARFSFVVP